LLCILLTLASAYDALATLELMDRGSWTEGNPLIAPSIEWSPTFFVLWKILAPLFIGVLMCVWTSRFRPIWWLLCFSAAAYVALACFHVYLLYFFAPSA
jgi:hypothetical protein